MQRRVLQMNGWEVWLTQHSSLCPIPSHKRSVCTTSGGREGEKGESTAQEGGLGEGEDPGWWVRRRRRKVLHKAAARIVRKAPRPLYKYLLHYSASADLTAWWGE